MSAVYFFQVRGRAVPAANNRLEALPRVAAWQQEVREAVRIQLGICRLVPVAAARMALGAPFELKPGQHAEIDAWFFFKGVRSADGANLQKALEDSLFGQDRELLDGTYHVRRMKGVDLVVVQLTISDSAGALMVPPSGVAAALREATA